MDRICSRPLGWVIHGRSWLNSRNCLSCFLITSGRCRVQPVFYRYRKRNSQAPGRKLEQKSHKGELIKSARALYDTCVESCEEVYGERVRTTEYIRINGQLVNTFMGVRHQVGVMVDANLGALNMPTRRELRTLQARMQEDRRECRRLRAELELLKGQAADPPAIQTGTGRKRQLQSVKLCPEKVQRGIVGSNSDGTN